MFHISNFFKRFDSHSNLVFWISMIEESLKIIPNKIDRNILDFGCGDGKFLHLYKMIDNYSQAYGIELNEELLKSADRKSVV